MVSRAGSRRESRCREEGSRESRSAHGGLLLAGAFRKKGAPGASALVHEGVQTLLCSTIFLPITFEQHRSLAQGPRLVSIFKENVLLLLPSTRPACRQAGTALSNGSPWRPITNS